MLNIDSKFMHAKIKDVSGKKIKCSSLGCIKSRDRTMYMEKKEILNRWTNQHSCHNQNNHCELVLQYMCHDNVRDGITTQTIPADRAQCEDNDCSTDRRYRMHEDYNYYMHCSMRSRNMGLFTADQQMRRRNTARNTRQNRQGTRRGYECPEERDYYPYWQPTPWVDIAVLTSDVKRCYYYQQESQNVKPRWACVFPAAVMERAKGKILLPITKEECEKYELPESVSVDDIGGSRKPEWRQFPSHNVPPPECRETEWTRDNHQGNTIGGHPPMFNWTIPKHIQHENCVIRIRYNISTSDYAPWDTNSSHSADPRNLGAGSKINLAEKFGLPTEKNAKARGFIVKNNPVVKLFDGVDLNLRLAINTAQFGRVFQDRSHTFAVRPVPEDLEIDAGAAIRNLNVRGKRGNIVQVFPAVEYDFVPNVLEMAVGDYVHIQWTGSNTNPNNNAGQGLAGSDRSNIVLLKSQVYPEGDGKINYPGGKFGHFGVNYPMDAANSTFLGLSKEDAITLAYCDPGQFRGEVSELDDAGTYFNLPPRKVTQQGTYHYMSTRNNNFSNRDQKGQVIVSTNQYVMAAIGWLGGNVTLGDGVASLAVNEGIFDGLKKVRLEKWSTIEGEKSMKEAGRYLDEGDGYASDFYLVTPEDLVRADQPGKTFTFEMRVTHSEKVEVYHSTLDFTDWSRTDADIRDGMARVQAQRGGIFVARSHSKLP
ncbi:protein dd3-3-like [Plakobranchus ocellatus]|uniref:Protein dd3-3-like n=1 Tax=Plakobranchus ocellatus TaxID=259542 RepID=A0AAV4DKA3_9GAST|nr:protein dd3-3-like [Plakobranchus ocellatus]